MGEVVLENVRKSYPGAGRRARGVEAVQDFSLHVGDGEFVVLVGPSGCGKSTTLRMIAGLEEVDAGKIFIAGRDVTRIAPKDRDIAMVFQNYALYPHMSVRKNMSFALRLRKVPGEEIDRRVRHAAKILDIEGLLDRKPRQLSGGQRQRVAVGRAIVREPKAFLFDEPLSNLDAKLRVSTRAELKALHQRLRTTTVYVTHDQEEAMTLGDRIVVMSRGEIQQVSTPLQAYRRPANRFVAGFVGMPPMNFLDGSLERDGDATVFVHARARLRIPPSHSALLDGRRDPVVLGIRPQALSDRPGEGAARGEWPTVSMVVGVIEPLGDHMDLACAWVDGGPPAMVARVRARDHLLPGAAITLCIDPSGLDVFEPGEFGRNLTLARGA